MQANQDGTLDDGPRLLGTSVGFEDSSPNSSRPPTSASALRPAALHAAAAPDGRDPGAMPCPPRHPLQVHQFSGFKMVQSSNFAPLLATR